MTGYRMYLRAKTREQCLAALRKWYDETVNRREVVLERDSFDWNEEMRRRLRQWAAERGLL